MDFRECMERSPAILMEGALGERLKREYGLSFDENIAMASMIYDENASRALSNLWGEYIDIARRYQLPFIATTPTRRANYERIQTYIKDAEKIVEHFPKHPEQIIYDNVEFLRKIQGNSGIQMYIGGLMGCKGDAYTGDGALSEEEAFEFHNWAAEHFAKAGVDFLYAGIMPVLAEAAGMARAMEQTGLPYIISFTIQADGKLIDGTTITDAIRYIDSVTKNSPVCYMTNCVHPRIVYQALSQPFNQNEIIKQRFHGIQANTSPLSYAELDEAVDLKTSEPEEFAAEMMKLSEVGDFKIWGGCCGTDDRHMECVARGIKCLK